MQLLLAYRNGLKDGDWLVVLKDSQYEGAVLGAFDLLPPRNNFTDNTS